MDLIERIKLIFFGEKKEPLKTTGRRGIMSKQCKYTDFYGLEGYWKKVDVEVEEIEQMKARGIHMSRIRVINVYNTTHVGLIIKMWPKIVDSDKVTWLEPVGE